MSWLRLIGTHLHLASNIVDFADAVQAAVVHAIISDKHSDTDTGDTPADGDVLTYDTADSKWHPVAPAATGYATVEDEGTPLTQRSTINFVGSGVSAADSGGKTVVTISGGGSGGGRYYIPFGSGSEVFSP